MERHTPSFASPQGDRRLLAKEGEDARPAPAKARVALIIPTLNEEEAIGPCLPAYPMARSTKSSSPTAEAVIDGRAGAGARREGIEAGCGYGRACWEGALAAGEGCDIVVFMDGDGADKPELISRLVAPIATGKADFVIGSRLRGSRRRAACRSIKFRRPCARLGDASCPRRALHRYVRIPRHSPQEPDVARHARDDLWLEHRDADAGGGGEAAHPRIAGRLRVARGRRLEGRRQPARHVRAGTRIIATFFRVWREMGRKER